MGMSWQILPELLGFTNPGIVDLFAHHPERDSIENYRKSYGIRPVDEIWVVITGGSKTVGSIKKLQAWYALLGKLAARNKRGEIPRLFIWQVDGTDDLATTDECKRMGEAITTIVLHARRQVCGGRLFLSLTGGRKTMSTDLQQAASWFGCNAMIHVIDNTDKSYTLHVKDWKPEKFVVPLPPEEADIFTPFAVGKFSSSALTFVKSDGEPDLIPENFPLPEPEASGVPVLFAVDARCPLITGMHRRQAAAGFLMSNYTNTMLEGETVTSFLALYSLPLDEIERLKSWRLGVYPEKEKEELAFLKKLPKAELHCHLGGVADTKELIRMAGAAARDISPYLSRLKPWMDSFKDAAAKGDALWIRKASGSLKKIRTAVPGVPPWCCTAAFILMFKDNPLLLEQLIYGDYFNDEDFCGVTFDPYEAMGDLQGTALLRHPGCLEEACRVIAEKAIDHNLLYLELRCSPINYSQDHSTENEGLSDDEVYDLMEKTLDEYRDRLKTSIIFIASRHNDIDLVTRHVRLAERIMESPDHKLRGFDLAGNEQACPASKMQPYLRPVMEKCLCFTIHAGENNPVASIWEAVYLLNAERIGHGLTLRENPDLLERFLDRNIVLEMCPSSNFQIIGYRDNHYSNTRNLEEYPLKHYLDKGLRVTVNTDNPGISRTDFTRELHRACRMTPGGLSMWEILSIIRNSFKASFAERESRHRLLREAESQIVRLLLI